jgi:5-oxoprolinase (ATP-hydrolysing)
LKRIGVDVGGTFTDVVYVDEESGVTRVEKVPSTPDDPARAVIAGVAQLCSGLGIELSEVDQFFHGTTVATNIALTHTGAEVGLITTEGFRDVIHIGRHRRPMNFSLQQDLPWQSRPLVKRRHRHGVRERVTAPGGAVLVPLDEEEVRQRVRELKANGVDSIAVCFLHSYLAPEHEQRVKAILAEEHPEAFLSISHEVLPVYREYERTSTVALNAYVGPKVSKYLTSLASQLAERGFRHDVQLMQSSGGMAPIRWAAERPVNLLMSGPVAGLIGSIWAARAYGHENVVSLDIGGTSADIGVAAGGRLRMRNLLDTKVGDYQAMVPMVDIDTIGAGGGSIAFIDEGGVYRVGPQSAGASPGPACYRRGGTDPTSTDAQAVLGRIRRGRGLLGGAMRVDVDLARDVFEPLAERLEMSVPEAALGALQIQKFGMTQAIELNSVRRGYDPREFTLVAGGGAGPLFACDIAFELEIPRVLVPPHPGILAATGLLASDVEHEFAATERHVIGRGDVARLGARLAGLEQEASQQLNADGVPNERRLLNRLADARYVGQGHELRFALPSGAVDETWMEETHERFHRAHEAEYGHRFDSAVEIVNLRVVGVGRIEELEWPTIEEGAGDASAAIEAQENVLFDVDGVPTTFPTTFYARERLRAGDRFEGPAIIEQYDTTVVVPPTVGVEVDRTGSLLLDCSRRAASSNAELAEPIRHRVIGGAFEAMAKEMASVLYRMAYSSIIRESEDLGAGVFDREGNLLAESDSTPMFVGAMSKIVKNVIAMRGDELHEGDVIVHNDPYRGATHTPDLAVITPIFFEGELKGFAGASAHLLDVGGAYPGFAMDLYDTTSEATIYRGVKLFSRGVRQDEVWRMMLDNTRTPTENRGDIEAMIAACRLAVARFTALLERHGSDAVFAAANHWLEYSERMLRQEITKLPDGVYETEVGWLDDDGVNRGVKLPIQVKVIVSGDEVTYDLTGSSPEVHSAFNVPFEGSTRSAMEFITRMVFLDQLTAPVSVPQNEGMFRPVNVIAPKGSIFNPHYPRACSARFCQVQRAVDLALRALAPVVPERVTAGNSAHTFFVSYSGYDEQESKYWVHLEVNEGSYGGRPTKDGMDAVDCLIANTRNNPIEEQEWRYPIRTERYELRDEPCAAGEWRGGMGFVRVNRLLTDCVISAEGDRHEGDPPWGIFGGHEGLNQTVTKNPGLEDEERWPAKFNGYRVSAGDVIEIKAPSSGGYGDPLDRSPDRVLADVLDGFTTKELAERDYGVLINADNTVNEPATRRRRGEMRTTRGRVTVAEQTT